MAVAPAPLRVPSQRPLAPCVMSVKSVAIMKWSRELYTDLLTAEVNPWKPQLGEVDDDCATSNRLIWDPFAPNEVDRIALYVRKGEGRKEGKGLFFYEFSTNLHFGSQGSWTCWSLWYENYYGKASLKKSLCSPGGEVLICILFRRLRRDLEPADLLSIFLSFLPSCPF